MELQECLLGEVFRICRVPRHAQAQRIYTPFIYIVQGREAFYVTLLSSLDRLLFRDADGYKFLCFRQRLPPCMLKCSFVVVRTIALQVSVPFRGSSCVAVKVLTSCNECLFP